MGYAIEYSDEAVADLQALRAFDRARIVDAITIYLTHEPTVVTRHRKPVVPSLELAGIGATWELQIGDYRALYDVEPATQVLVIRVIHKGTLTLADALAAAKKAKGEDE